MPGTCRWGKTFYSLENKFLIRGMVVIVIMSQSLGTSPTPVWILSKFVEDDKQWALIVATTCHITWSWARSLWLRICGFLCTFRAIIQVHRAQDWDQYFWTACDAKLIKPVVIPEEADPEFCNLQLTWPLRKRLLGDTNVISSSYSWKGFKCIHLAD